MICLRLLGPLFAQCAGTAKLPLPEGVPQKMCLRRPLRGGLAPLGSRTHTGLRPTRLRSYLDPALSAPVTPRRLFVQSARMVPPACPQHLRPCAARTQVVSRRIAIESDGTGAREIRYLRTKNAVVSRSCRSQPPAHQPRLGSRRRIAMTATSLSRLTQRAKGCGTTRPFQKRSHGDRGDSLEVSRSRCQ